MLYWAPENRQFENKSDIGRKYLIPEQLALQAYDIIMQYFIRLIVITTLRNIIQSTVKFRTSKRLCKCFQEKCIY
jgi:hypothetical protein